MSSDLVIDARGVSKLFKLYDKPSDRFREWLSLGRVTRHHAFWAVRDVDLHLERGEKLGIIGANGSGKSTLLKLLSGSLSPTSGTVRTVGRAFALIELSTGFNKDLTGRENISFVGMMLGLEREYVEQRREQIIEFADIGDFIDRPVRFYSSGMFVRLAFSLFAFLDPDLLMIDEAFAVGDAEFKEKSYALMRSMVRTQGRSVIFVSHSLHTIESVCDRVMWLEHGECREVGKPRPVIEAYRSHLKERKDERKVREHAQQSAHSESEATQKPIDWRRIQVPAADLLLPIIKKAGDGTKSEVTAVWLEEKDGKATRRIGAHRKCAIGCVLMIGSDVPAELGVRIMDMQGTVITSLTTSEHSELAKHEADARQSLAVLWPIARGLPPGEYTIECWAGEKAPSERPAGGTAKLHVDGPARVEGVYHLVMRPLIGRPSHGR